MGDSEIDTLRAYNCVEDLGELAGRQVRPAYARFAQATKPAGGTSSAPVLPRSAPLPLQPR